MLNDCRDFTEVAAGPFPVGRFLPFRRTTGGGAEDMGKGDIGVEKEPGFVGFLARILLQ